MTHSVDPSTERVADAVEDGLHERPHSDIVKHLQGEDGVSRFSVKIDRALKLSAFDHEFLTAIVNQSGADEGAVNEVTSISRDGLIAKLSTSNQVLQFPVSVIFGKSRAKSEQTGQAA